MVLQQAKPVPVWGTGTNGTMVTVSIQGQSAKACITDGCWKVTLPPLQPGGPFELVVQGKSEGAGQGDEERIVCTDVLVGEVWIAAGQSNMEQQLLFTEDCVQEAETGTPAQSGAAQIRFFTIPRRPFEGAVVPGWHFIGARSEEAAWQPCTPETALRFSAIGYYFAKRLQPGRGVPVGIVCCAFGGTPIEAWMDDRVLEDDRRFQPLIEAYREKAGRISATEYEAVYADYVRAADRMIEERGDVEGRVRQLGLDGYRDWVKEHPLLWPAPPMGPKHPQRPGGLYRAMLRTVVPFAVRGVLWYQGESNVGAPHLYADLLSAMIGNWRRDWETPDLPFLLVQLPAYLPGGQAGGTNWAELREAQRRTAADIPHVAMVVALDCGEASDIHPVRKQPIAERLALAAQAVVYGEDASYEAPECIAMEITGARVRLTFDSRGGGLRTGDAAATGHGGHARLTGFTLSGADGVYCEADAELLDPTTVAVWCDSVERPHSVRYAWNDWPAYSLFGLNGVPVGPFAI
ncbi:sialate O-acetylesterase [Paenibacillus sp. HJGM_3]